MVLISVGVCLPLDFGHHLVSATVASEEDGAVTVAPDDVTEQATDPPTTDTADVVTDGAAAEDDDDPLTTAAAADSGGEATTLIFVTEEEDDEESTEETDEAQSSHNVEIRWSPRWSRSGVNVLESEGKRQPRLLTGAGEAQHATARKIEDFPQQAGRLAASPVQDIVYDNQPAKDPYTASKLSVHPWLYGLGKGSTCL